ncbi:MAG: helix-turn-helix transcriptional regulator [Erysipelothrix sp.]|nr:helix-turn-helix transcriptional regulator [Erysipelothrix sp.]
MAIKYYKLIDLLNRRGILKTKFAKDIGISPNTLAKLSNNQIVSLDVIDKACEYLGVQPGDLLEFIDEGNYTAK